MEAAEATEPTWLARLMIAAAVTVGAVSLIANVTWNCRSCGWDPHGAPSYQTLVVAGVPFIVTPLGVVVLAARAVWLRSRRTVLEFAAASAGLALPWIYYLVVYLVYGF